MPYVRPHVRAGHYVRGHWRRRSGGGLALPGGALALVVLAALFIPQLLPGPALTRPDPERPAPAPKPPTVQAPRTDRSHYIVQVASERRREQAAANAAHLQARGFGNAGALRSDHYGPLRPGWWVTYIGPFPPTPAGRAEAAAIQQRLPDSLIRRIH